MIHIENIPQAMQDGFFLDPLERKTKEAKTKAWFQKGFFLKVPFVQTICKIIGILKAQQHYK